MAAENDLLLEDADLPALEPRRRVRWPLLTVTAVVGLGLFSWWLGPVALVAPWDNFILLDGGYRIAQGQVPGTDFSNAIGPLVYALTSLGMQLQAVPSFAAVTYGCLLFLPVAAVLAGYVAHRRLPGGYATGFTVFMALLVISVRPPGYSPGTTTYAMLYNKFGWLLYSTLLLAALVRPRTRRPLTDGAAIGLLLGLLAYDKANFFLMAVLAVVLGLILRTLAARAVAGAVAGFGLIVVVFWLGFGIGPAGYAKDVVTAFAAQGTAKRLNLLVHSIAYNAPAGVLALLVVAGLFWLARRRGEPARPWRLLVLTLFVLGSSVVISAADSPEKSDLAALVVIPLVLVAALKPELPRWTGGDGRGRMPVPLLAGLVLLLVATTAPIAGKDALALGISAARREVVAAPPPAQRITSPHLGDFVVPADSTWQTAYRTASAVPAMLDDGLALLRRHIRPGDRVVSMSLANPFAFALDLTPATGGPLWWDLEISFDEQTHPAAEQVFGDAEWVMVPKLRSGQGCCQDTVEAMNRIYGGYLAQRFRMVESTEDWTLLARG
ncbi:hypothetical protein [Amycolatopsis orientalis]|uniref:hypothetical protein n=1 Tax=Amycolatopsis orientalis TaxID=31958 RepID=UPI0003A87DF4|nr:hypothetical protein [Amycolatopsis orientalis]